MVGASWYHREVRQHAVACTDLRRLFLNMRLASAPVLIVVAHKPTSDKPADHKVARWRMTQQAHEVGRRPGHLNGRHWQSGVDGVGLRKPLRQWT